MVSQIEKNSVGLLGAFHTAKDQAAPFHYDWKPLDMGLWVLYVAKSALDKPKLTAADIAQVLVEVVGVSIEQDAITKAFNRANGKVHIYKAEGQTCYGIMKSGIDSVLDLSVGGVRAVYFTPGKKYESKILLADSILSNVQGQLCIVDPYCGPRTLDVLARAPVKTVTFLTRLAHLDRPKQEEFLRVLQDFKPEHAGMQFRDYPNTELHDRYIVDDKAVILLGCSIKDLGSKESLAVVLPADENRNVRQELLSAFGRRWKLAQDM